MNGTALAKLLKERGISQAELARAIGVSSGSVSLWLSGSHAPKLDSASRIADFLGVPMEVIIGSNRQAIHATQSDPAYVPLRGRVHAGDGSDPDILDASVPIPFEVYEGHPSAFLLEVEGDCMDRVLPPGCLILVDPLMSPMNRSIAVVNVGEDYLVRRLTIGADTLMLSPESHNPEWSDLVAKDGNTVELVGTVVWYQPREELS